VFVWVALERQIFTAHPINATDKETTFCHQTETKAREERQTDQKRCRNVMPKKNGPVRV